LSPLRSIRPVNSNGQHLMRASRAVLIIFPPLLPSVSKTQLELILTSRPSQLDQPCSPSVHPLKAPLHPGLPFHSLYCAFHLFLHYLMRQIPTLHSNLKKQKERKANWTSSEPKSNGSPRERERQRMCVHLHESNRGRRTRRKNEIRLKSHSFGDRTKVEPRRRLPCLFSFHKQRSRRT
jgi:hypothetical protein